MKFTGIVHVFITLIAFLSFVPAVHAETFENKKTHLDYQWLFSLYGGLHASNTLNDMVSFDADYSDGNNVLVAALAREVYRYEQYLRLEIEGQVGRIFGEDGSAWECVGLGLVRWQMFPWDDVLDTSIAIGAGFSYYSNISQVEKNRNEEAQRLLGYLAFELTFGVPRFSRWDLLMRIHHRSGMGGVIGEGSSNYACIGVKYAF